MKPNKLFRWLSIAITALLFVGCGDSHDVNPVNPGNSGGPTRAVQLQFDYGEVMAQMPASVAGYRVEIFSASGELQGQQSVSGRVPEMSLTGVTTQAFILRVLGLDGAGQVIGYSDLSVPEGTAEVTLRIEILLSGTPTTASYTPPNGQATRLAFLVHPSNTGTSQPFSVAVVVLDAAGYRVNGVNGSVELTLTGSGALSGLSSVNFSSGVATFSGLSVNSPGTNKVLTANSTNLTSAQSLPFTVVSNTPAEPVVQIPLQPGATIRQSTPVITSDSNGNFVSLWSDDYNQVVGRRLTPEGQMVGERFVVDSQGHYPHDVGKLPNGGFVAVWRNHNDEVRVQRFDANNTPLGTSVFLTDNSAYGRVASDATGRYVVTYAIGSAAVMVQRFHADGTPNGTAVHVNSVENDFLLGHHTDIGSDAEGNFVVVWTNTEGVGSVCCRLYDRDGNPKTGIFDIASGVVNGAYYTNPTVDMSSDGRFVVAYEYLPSTSSSNFELRMRTFSAAAVGSAEMSVPTTALENGFTVDAAMRDDGSFALSWTRNIGAVGSPFHQVWTARFSADGTLQGEVSRAGDLDTRDSFSRVAISPSGTFAVVWTGNDGVLLNAYYSGFPTGTP